MTDGAFAVMSDEATVIGADYDYGQYCLTMECIDDMVTTHLPISFGSHDGKITSVVLMENSHTLLVGDSEGNVVQYLHDTATNTWSVTRNYGFLGIDDVNFGIGLGHFAVFGGKNGRIRILDTQKTHLLENFYKTGISCVYSLSPCTTEESQALVSVTGILSNYSEELTDLLDVSRLIRLRDDENADSSGSDDLQKNRDGVSKSFDKKKNTNSKHDCQNCMFDVESIYSRVAAKLEQHMQDAMARVIEKVLQVVTPEHGKQF